MVNIFDQLSTVYIFQLQQTKILLSVNMDKRMVQLLEAFQHLKFEECLRMSDQIIKKMDKSDNKKKNALSDDDIENLYLTRIGSLAATAHLHQANELINSKFLAPVVNEKSSFLFMQIAMMALDQRIQAHVTTIVDSKVKKFIDINRFILMVRKFSVLARIFLKKFAVEKKNEDSFAQIYLQYLQQLQNNRMISFHRDNIITENKALDFKFVSLFLDKFVATIKTIEIPKQKLNANIHMKTVRAVADLKIKIAIRQGKAEIVRKLLQQHEAELKDNAFVYYRSLINMSTDQDLNSITFIRWYLSLFKNNLDLDKYQPVYDFSIQFVTHLVCKSKRTLPELMLDYKLTTLAAELYTYRQSPKDQLWSYIDSLYSEYGVLREKSAAQKKKDYYKIALKNCMLLLVYVLVNGNKTQQSRNMLLQYKQEYGKKLTFVDEIWSYTRKQTIFTQEFLNQFITNPAHLQGADDKLIWNINQERLSAKNPIGLSYEQNLKQWHRLHQLYSANLVEIQHQKKLQKGERYLSDQFLSIMVDSIRKYSELANASEKEIEQLYFLALGHLQTAIKRSPYNHDLKVRAIYFYNWLNYHEQSFKLLESLDIKAVQFETLGYFYLRELINFGAWDSNEQLLVRMVRSYQETFKESIEYAYKALICSSFNECEQNLCYSEHIQNSYNFLVLMYVLYLKHRGKPNSEFYLQFIRDKLATLTVQNITLSCDGRVFTNVCDRDFPEYVDFYGIYNKPNILLTEVQLKLLMIDLANNKTEQQTEQLRKIIKVEENVKSVYSFDKFRIFDRTINYQFSGGKMRHERRSEVQLRIVNKISSIKLRVCDLVISIRKEGNIDVHMQETIQLLIKQLCQMFNSLTWRLQTMILPQIRSHVADIIALLSVEVETLSSKKKKVQGQAQKKQACQQIISSLVEAVTEHVKLQFRLQTDKQFANESFWNRDEFLQRVSKMTSNEYKKTFKLKI